MAQYVPSHLEHTSDRQGDGWPSGIDAEGKAYATAKATEALASGRVISLKEASESIYGYVVRNHDLPECLQSCMWDRIFAITHRALLASSAREVWAGETWMEDRQRLLEAIAIDNQPAESITIAMLLAELKDAANALDLAQSCMDGRDRDRVVGAHLQANKVVREMAAN